jgi:flavorubredoxin
MGVETVAGPVSVKYVPDEDALQKCRQLGLDIAARLQERLAAP